MLALCLIHFKFSLALGTDDRLLGQAPRVADIVDRYINRLKAVLEEGISSGELRQDLDAEATAVLIFGFTQGVVNLWALNNYDFDLKKRYDTVWSTFRLSIMGKETGQLLIENNQHKEVSVDKIKFIKKARTIVFPVVMAIALVAVGILSSCASGGVNKTVIFADGSWDSIQLHNRVAAYILDNGYGYTSEYIFGDTIPLFSGLSRGDIDVCMEVWIENQQKAYDTYIADGSIVDLGSNFNDNWQGWLVPTYMIKGDAARGIVATAPNLKFVSDLAQYQELFKDPEQPSKGRFVNGPAGWEATGINSEKLDEYGLLAYYSDFSAGSDTALSASLASAYEKGEPWFGYYWEPTWVMGKYDMTRLEEPAYDATIWNTTHACAYPANKVNICLNTEFKDKNPDVATFLGKYATTTQMLNELLAYMQDNHASTQQTAEYFLKNYESLWTTWVSADVAAKVKTALG